MAAEPIVIYSHKVDPAGVLRVLRAVAPELHVDGPEDDWKTITITGPKRLLRRAWALNFGHDRAYDTGDRPISRAAADAVQAATSTALERHLAINWLCGGY